MKPAKEKSLAHIYKIMRREGLSLEDVKNYVLKQPSSFNEFDLLCLINGEKKRVPFSDRHKGEPIGIFPFKHEPEYIELKEVDNKKHTDPDVDQSRLLDEHFCDRVSKIVHTLNNYLKMLGKPPLDLKEGYLADSSYMQGCGWIIGFDGSGDYHGGNVPAKLRYMGKFPYPVS